jgi:hypothetical protein
MKCISSPALDNVDIAMYVDGEADEATVAHIQQCPFCSERARQWTLLQNRLRKQAYRVNCPIPTELGDYNLGLLPAQRALLVSAHLRECLLCKQEVAALEDFLTDLAPETSLLGAVKVLIARLISRGADELSSVPSFTGLRGEADEPFIYQADNIRIVVEVQDDVEQMGLKTLLGLVIGLESNDFTIQVSQEGQAIATTLVDEIGNFVISHLSPGHYSLRLIGSSIEILIQSLSVF